MPTKRRSSPDFPPPAPASAAPATSGNTGPREAEAGREAPPGKTDVVLIHGVTDDGKGLKVLRQRDDQLEVGSVRPVEEGKPLAGDLVRLQPRKEFPLLCDVQTQFTLDRPESAEQRRSSGPAQVASDAYRKNWDLIWSRKETDNLVN